MSPHTIEGHFVNIHQIKLQDIPKIYTQTQSHTMGEAAFEKTERLLVTFFKEIPAPLVAHIERQFPEAEVTIYQSQKGVPVPRGWS